MKNSEIFDMNGCVVKSSKGVRLAKLVEEGDCLVVKPLPACTIGTYFYILWHLKELGFDVK